MNMEQGSIVNAAKKLREADEPKGKGKYWSRKQLAEYLGVSPQTVSRKVDLGLIKEENTCGVRRYHKGKNNIPREDW